MKEECLSRLIFFGENSLRRALTQYSEHYHRARHRPLGALRCRERLGGLLKYYERRAIVTTGRKNILTL